VSTALPSPADFVSIGPTGTTSPDAPSTTTSQVWPFADAQQVPVGVQTKPDGQLSLLLHWRMAPTSTLGSLKQPTTETASDATMAHAHNPLDDLAVNIEEDIRMLL
jgi:hypothetical protein